MRRLGLATSILLLLGASSVSYAQDIVRASTLSRGQGLAEDEGRVVLVAIASPMPAGVGPWTDTDVQRWLQSHAVLVEVDPASGHGAALRGSYLVDRVPTLLAFRGERLLSRYVGDMAPHEILKWLSELTGEAPPQTSAMSPAELSEALRAIDTTGQPRDAITELIKLWVQSRTVLDRDERRTRLLDAMTPILRQSFQATEQVRSLRDRTWAAWTRDRDLEDLHDWIGLNDALEETAATVRWARANTNDRCEDTIGALLTHPSDPLLSILDRNVEHRLWGRCVADPVRTLTDRDAAYRSRNLPRSGQHIESARTAHRAHQAAICAALLASGRETEARRASHHLYRTDRGAGPVIVRAALDLDLPRRWHKRLTNAADPDNASLVVALHVALGTQR
jgi:hypothetical protein